MNQEPDKTEGDDFLTNPRKQLESLLRRTWMAAGGKRDETMHEWIKTNTFLYPSINKALSPPQEPDQLYKRTINTLTEIEKMIRNHGLQKSHKDFFNTQQEIVSVLKELKRKE